MPLMAKLSNNELIRGFQEMTSLRLREEAETFDDQAAAPQPSPLRRRRRPRRRRKDELRSILEVRRW